MLIGRPDADRRFYARLLDDHLALVDVDRMELRVLNPTASALWLLLGEGGWTRDQLTKALAALFQQDAVSVGPAVAACLEEWDALGWVERRETDGTLRVTGATVPPIRREGVYPAAPGERAPAVPLTEMRLGMVGADVAVRLGHTDDSPFIELLARVKGMLSGFSHGHSQADDAAATLTFLAADDRIWVGAPDGLVWSADPSGALSHLMLHLLLAGGASAPLLATVHAAAMGRGDGLLMLPGLSGNGKSTLTAYLAARGWDYAGDDIVALTQADGGPLLATPFPTAVSLKPGSWDVLAAHYPEIADLPTISYAEKKARFLPLPAQRLVGATPGERAVRLIVFPRFDPQATGEAEPISTLDALLELIAAGFTAGDRLERARLDRFFDFLEAAPKYRLAYPSLEAAERGLSALAP